MKSLKRSIYSAFGDFEFLEIAKKLDFTFAIEAGVHDGSDSEKLLLAFPGVVLYGFEPDPVAFNRATIRLQNFQKTAIIANKALSDRSGYISLIQSGELGSGSTRVTHVEYDIEDFNKTLRIQSARLDSEINMEGFGILWLDVEGHAIEVLSGAQKVLNSIIAAKIEIQMHDMYGSRKRDAWEVIARLKPYNLIPIKLPVYPGFFGDILFVRRDLCTRTERAKSKFLRICFFSLHRIIFAILKIPKNEFSQI